MSDTSGENSGGSSDTSAEKREGGGFGIKQIGLWTILVILGLAFGLSFGLPSDAISFGQQPLAKAFGDSIQMQDYNYQFAALQMSPYVKIPKSDKKVMEMMGVKEETLDAIVERRVLVNAANEMGLNAATSDAEDLVAEGQIIVLGDTFLWLDRFNYDIFKRWLVSLQTNERDFLEVQRQELLARTVRDLITSSTVVSEGELRRVYEERANKLSLRYVRFQSAYYADLVDPAPEDIDAYVASHKDELKRQFESQGVRFTKLPKQVRLRFIQVNKPKALAEGADADAVKTHEEAKAAAKAKIDGAVAALAEKDFRAVARELSEDASTARRGGDYGWVSLEGTGTGLEAVVDEAALTLGVGQTSEVIESDDAYYVVKVDGVREGDVPEEDALRELATEALMDEGGKSLAKQAAEEALLKIKDDGKQLSELFSGKNALGSDSLAGGIDEIPLDGADGGADGGDGPRMRVTGLFGKGASIPGIGPQPELTNAAWSADDKAEVIDRVFETTDGVIVAGVERKESASDEGFQEARGDLYRELATNKSVRINSWFAKNRCLEAKGKGQITPMHDKIKRLVTYDTNLNVDEDGARQLRPYSMCDRVGMRGSFLRLGGLEALSRGLGGGGL
ncbi:MAG: peptidylprolyl isomerase [Myxococcales bacterium]|nr:peptidylprolyl isomerase [Myxococcales bacterium]MCB9754842.1 peptidylprolyl isomerase [Myxococcales bacterium]